METKEPARHSAYVEAMTCVAANAQARSLRIKAGDIAKAAIYEKQESEAFGVAIELGKVLHLDSAQINHDLKIVETDKLPTMVQNQEYFYQVVAMCKGRGLM